MINLMLIAGDRTEKLATFMEDRGTFTVEFAFDSLSMNLGQIKDSIINVDKLMYLYQPSNVSIRSEMQLLKELLSQNGFFNASEIIFAVTTTDDSEKAIQYFEAAMNDCNYHTFSIKRLGAKPSFADIYDAILGVSRSMNFMNSYKDVYRVERNSDSKKAYVPQDDSDLKIEPFNYDRLTAYNQAKLDSIKIESNIQHHDSMAESEKFDNPVLGSIEYQSVLHSARTEIITGYSKAGVTTWACALANSTLLAQQDVTVVDFSDNCDFAEIMFNNNIPVNEISMLELLRLYEPKKGVLNVCSAKTLQERDVKLEFLKNMYSKKNLSSGFIFIIVPFEDFDRIFRVLHNDVDSAFIGVTPIHSNVIRLQQDLDKYAYQIDIKVFLNRHLRLMDEKDYLDAANVRQLIPFENVGIIDSIDFTNFDVGASLYNKVLEV